MDNKLKELLYTAAYCSDSNELRIAAEECGKQAESCSDETAAEIMKMLYQINANGTTIIMVTHDHSIIETSGKRVIVLEKGKIISDSKKGGEDKCQQEPTL